MNYGKLAYLKATDLEKRLSSLSQNEDSDIDCFEISKENLSIAISPLSIYRYDFATINAGVGCDCCIFLTLNIAAQTASNIVARIKFNDQLVTSKSCALSVGDNEINLKSVASSIAKGEGVLSLEIESDNAATLSALSLIVIGAKTESQSVKVELKACALNDDFAISYIANGTIKYFSSSFDDVDLNSAQFSDYKPAKTHAVCFDEFNDPLKRLTFAFVSQTGELYLSRLGENQDIFIDNQVSSVCVGNNSEEECLALIYVKNGKVVFKTLKEGLLSNISELNLPPANYISVRSILGVTDKTYIIATDESLNNYVCASVGAPETDRVIENVKFGFGLVVNTYIYKDRYPFNGIENVNCAIMFVASATVYAKSVYNFTQLNDVRIGCNIKMSSYTISADDIVYGVDFDLNGENFDDGIGNCVYTDDCVGLTPASLTGDPTAPVYSPGSWENRWPFNVIKPCLFKDENTITYLDRMDYTKNETNTQTGLDIKTGTKGDVMIEFPRIYYRIAKTPEGVLQFRVSNNKHFGYDCFSHLYKGEECSKVYVGAYPSVLRSNKYYSLKGYTKSTSSRITKAKLRTNTAARGANYESMNIYVCTMIKMLFIIMFKSIDYAKSIGNGLCYSGSGGPATGTTDAYPAPTYGFFQTSNSKPERFIGIEGFASMGHYYLEGVYGDRRCVGIMDVEGVSNNWFNNDCTDYMFYKTVFPSNFRRVGKYAINNYFGMFPVEFSNQVEVYGFDFFRSKVYFTTGKEFRVHFPDMGATMGLFSYQIVGETYSNPTLGHRLIYYKK